VHLSAVITSLLVVVISVDSAVGVIDDDVDLDNMTK
jgi:hypothetical protein